MDWKLVTGTWHLAAFGRANPQPEIVNPE